MNFLVRTMSGGRNGQVALCKSVQLHLNTVKYFMKIFCHLSTSHIHFKTLLLESIQHAPPSSIIQSRMTVEFHLKPLKYEYTEKYFFY